MEYLKKLYGTTVIDSSDSEDDGIEGQIELEYYKTKNGLVVLEDKKPYGIEIIKKKKENEQLNIEAKVINNMFDEETKINKLLDLLIKNKVTPISVEDILADLITV